MIVWLTPFVLSALISAVTSYEVFIDSQQCHALHKTQFQSLLQDFVSGAPTTLISDKQAFTNYLTERFINNEYPGITITPPVDFSNTTDVLLPSLISQYLQSSVPNQEVLTQIAIQSILNPGFPIPHPIREDIVSTDILFTEPALTALIDTYLMAPSPLLLPHIADLATQFPFYAIPNGLMNELVNRGYLEVDSVATLTKLIPLALASPLIPNLERILQLSNQFTTVHLPAALVRTMIENSLLTSPQGETYYRRLLADSSLSLSTPYLLQQILEYSNMYRNIAIPDPIISLLLQAGLISTSSTTVFSKAFDSETMLIELIRQAVISPSSALLQQIAHLAGIFPNVPIPAVIMRQLIISNLINISRGEALFVSLIQAAQVSPTIEILRDIALLYDLFPYIVISESILRLLSENQLISLASENTFTQIIEQQLMSPTLDSLKQISQLSITYPNVPLPTSIQNQVGLMNSLNQYIASPSLNVLQDLANGLPAETSFPIPSLLRREINELVASPASLQPNEAKLQSLVLQYLEVPNDSLLDEMLQIIPIFPNFPIPTPIAIALAQRIESPEIRQVIMTTVVNKLVEEWMTTHSEIPLYQLAELCARMPGLTFPDTLANALTPILRDLGSPTATTSVTYLIELINRYHATQSVLILNEIFIVAQQFPDFPIPEFVIFQFLIQQYVATGSIEILRQISIFMFKFQEVICPEMIIESLITQNVWVTSPINTRVILHYLVVNHGTTQSYVILKFIYDLFWLHPETDLSIQIVDSLIRYGLLKISQTQYNVQVIYEYLMTITKLIRSYQETRSVSILEQIIQIVQVITCYPLPNNIWIDYYVLMYQRTLSKYYLEEIGRRMYLSWSCVIPENIFALILKENFLLGTINSETDLMQYIITNYPSTSSPYILAAMYHLYQRYSQISLPANMYNLLVRYGLITNTVTDTAESNIVSIIQELDEMTGLDTSDAVFVFGVLPWRQATLEKLIIVSQNRLADVQAIARDLASRGVDSALPTYQIISNLVNSILSTANFFITEADVRASANREFLLNAQVETQSFMNNYISDFGQNFQVSYSGLGRVKGILESFVFAYEDGQFNIAALGDIIRQLLMLDGPLDSIDSIFDDLIPLITLNEGMRASVLESILPYRLESVEKSVLVNRQRFQQLSVLVEETVRSISTSGYQSEAAIAQILNSVLALIKSFITEANARIVQNRNMFITISTSGFVISSTDLEIFTDNLKIAELNLGRAAGAIESVVIAISSGDISVSSIAVIIREILKLDTSIATIESFYDDFLSMPSLSNTVVQSTLAATLPWRIAVVERHVSAVQYRLQDLTALIQSLIQTSQSDLAQVLSVVLNYVTSLTNEANSRLIANRNIYQNIVSSNFGINRQQLTAFDENEKLILLNLGRASGATEAIVIAYLSGQLSVLQLSSVIQIILQLDTSVATVNSVYTDLSVLSSLSVTSNLQVTLITILKHLLGQTGVVQLTGTLSDASSLQAILQSVQTSLLSGAVTGVTSVDDVVALQIILAVSLPGRQATLDKHIIIETQQFNELTTLTNDIILSSIDAGPAYASTAAVVEQIMALASNLLSTAQQLANQNRQFVSSALKRNFLVSSAELQAFTKNVQVAGGALGRLSGIIEVISQAYNNGAFSVNTIGVVLKYVLQFEEFNINVQQLLEEIETMELEEKTRISVLSILLPWRLASVEKLVSVYQNRLAEVSILTTDIIRTTQQTGFETLLSSIVTTLSSMLDEASGRLLASRNILEWLSQGGREQTGLTSYTQNLIAVMTILGRVEGAIDAVIEAYTSGKFTYTAFSVILQSLTSVDTTISNIESVYDDLSVISSFAVGSNFQNTLQSILESILGQTTSLTAGTATSAVALRSLLGSINYGITTQVNTDIKSGGDVIALQTILAVTMSSVQSTLEKYLSVTQSRFTEFQTLSSDVQAKSLEAGDAFKYVASYISQMLSSLAILIEEASVKTVASRGIVMQASRNSFLVSLGDVRIFVDNMKFAFRNLGRAAGVMEAFVNAYNLGQFRLSTIRFILQSLYKYDQTLLSTELEYGGLDALYMMDDTSRQVILSQVLPWRHANSEMRTRLYTNRLAELQILTSAITKSGVNPVLLNVVKSIEMYVSSIIKEYSARQVANKNILNYAASRQFAVSMQDLVPFDENQAIRASLAGKIDGAFDALIAAYLAGDFSVNTVTTIVQSLINSDVTLGNVESVYDDLSLLSALSVPLSSNLPITLQSIVKNYLGATNYAPYTGALDEAVGLRSLLGSLSVSLKSGLNFNSVTSVSDVVALQTILAVILPARQASVDKLLLISQSRLQQITTLISDYTIQATDAGSYSQPLVNLLNQVASSITYMVNDARVRADENRAFVNRVALKSFLLSSEELQPFIANIQTFEKLLGRANGAIDSIVLAYNEGQLTISKIQLIIENLRPFDQSIIAIDSIFEELTSAVIVYGASYRPALLAKLLPWRFATIERHCTINKDRIKELQTLIEDTIIQNANPIITVLLTSTMNLVNSLTQEAQSSFMIVENSIKSIKEREYNADDDELLAMTKRVQKIGETLGKAAGAMEAVAKAYNAGEFSVHTVTLIIEQLFKNEVTVSSVETIYDELAPLTNSVAGTSLQTTLNTILAAHTSTVAAPFGSTADAIALRSVLKNIEETFTEQYIQSGVSSVNDVVALQTVLAVLLPSRLATLDKFILVTQERFVKLQILFDETVARILQSDLPSRDGVASLLRGVMTMIQYFNSQAQARASISRDILNVALSRRFLLTFDEMKPFTENLVIAFDALGRSAGGTDALIAAIESGELNLLSLKMIIQTLLEIDDSINLIEGIFADLQPLMVVQGIDLRNILAIILPHRIATLNMHVGLAKERLIEFTILIDNTVAQALSTGIRAYQGLAAVLNAILSLVRSNIVKAAEYAALNDQFLARAITANFDVSTADLKTFTQNVQKAGLALGKANAAIDVVSVTYRSGELSVNSIQLVIQSLIQLDTSVNNVEQLFDTLKSLYLTDINTRQTALAIFLPWRLAQTEKMITVNDQRTIALTKLIQSIITENSKNPGIVSLAQSILQLINSYSTDISSRFLASKNVISWVESSNYNVNLDDLVSFNENELVIWNTLGKIAGVTEALSIAYVAGEFSVNSLDLIIQTILVSDSSATTIESVYDDVSFLATLPVGSSISQTLQSILMNYLGTSSPVEYTGTMNDAAALRSLLSSIFTATQQSTFNTQVSTIDQGIALQTILAVFLPARQALIDKLVLLSKIRLEKLIILVNDYTTQVTEAGVPQQAISQLLQKVVSSVRSLIAEAEIRTNENRQIVMSSAKKQFFISTLEIQPLMSNVKVALKYLGQAEGAMSAVSEAYSAGQLSIKQITVIIEKMLEIEPALTSIGAIYDELRSIVLQDVAVRPLVLSKLLPWRLATVESHLDLFVERTVQFKILTDSIVSTMPDARLKLLVSSIWTLTSSLTGQAQSRYIALKNGIDYISSNNFVVSDEQLNSVVRVVQVIADSISRGEAIIEALSVAYYQGAFTVSTVTTIINDLINIDTTSAALNQIYDELGMLSTVTVGSNLQGTLSSLLSNLGVQRSSTAFGTTNEALALRSLLGSINTALSSNLNFNIGISSVADVIALQTIFAVMLPARQATLEKFLIVHQTRFEEMKLLVNDLIVQMSASSLPSQNQIVSLLRGIVSLVNYYMSEAQIRATANRESLNLAIKRRFLLSSQEYQPFMDSLMIAFGSLGRAAGGSDALVLAINSGDLSVNSLTLIIETILQSDRGSDIIGQVFDDLQPLLSMTGIDQRNILAVLMPSRQAVVEKYLLTHEEQLVEFTILINNYVDQIIDNNAVAYRGLGSLLKGILQMVTQYITESASSSSQSAKIVSSAAAKGFDVSQQELQSFWQSIAEIGQRLGRAEGAMNSVTFAYNSGQLTINTITLVIKQLLQLEESVAATEGIFSSLESLYALNVQSRQSILSVVVPWRIATTEKLLLVNEGRIQQLQILIEDIILQSQNSTLRVTLQSILNLIISLFTEASARLIANKNILTWITEQNFDVNLNDLVAFNENDVMILQSLGRIAGATEALALAYASGQFTIKSVTLIIENTQLIDQSTTQIESLYDGLADLSSLAAGSNFAVTLKNLVNNYAGDTIDYRGTINEANAFRALLRTISNGFNTLPATSMNDVIAFQTIFATILPTRQAFVDKLIIVFQQRIQKFVLLTSDIIQKLTANGAPATAVTTLVNQLTATVNYLFKEAEVRASDNRLWITAAARRLYLISSTETFTFLKNIEVIESTLGRLSGIIDAVSAAYTSGQFSVRSIVTVIQDFRQFDQSIPAIESIYDELSTILSFNPATRQQILAYLLPWRQATVEKHININQARANDLTLLIESIIQSSNQNVIRQLVHNLLSYVLSLTNEANSRFFANKEMLSLFAANNYVVSDEQLQAYTSNVQVCGMTLGRAMGVSEAITYAYIQGDLSFSAVVPTINSMIGFDNNVVEIESLYDSLEPLFSTPLSGLRQILSSILPTLGSPEDVSLTTALDLQNAALAMAPVSSTAVLSPSDIVGLQIILSVSLPHRQSTLDYHISLTSQDIATLYGLVNTAVTEYSIISSPSTTQLLNLLREMYSLIAYVFDECVKYAAASRDFINVAISRNYLVNSAELQKVVSDMHISTIALGKATGAVQAALAAFGVGTIEKEDIRPDTITNIINQLKNSLLVKETAEQFSAAVEAITQSQTLITAYLESGSLNTLREISQVLISYPNIFIPDTIRSELARLGFLPGSTITEEIMLLRLIEEYKVTQTETILSQMIPLLMTYTETKVPLVVVVALINKGVLIQSENYYNLVISQYPNYPDQAIILISHLISQFPQIPLTLPILEHLVRVNYISMTVLDQLVRIWLDTQSSLALRLILEIYQRFPTYSLPIAILDQIYDQTVTTTVTTTTSQLSLLSSDTSELTKTFTDESLLQQLIVQFQQFPSEALLLEIDELSRLLPQFALPAVIQEQVTLLRLVQETVLLPTPSISTLQQISILSSQFPIVTIPSSLVEQINLVTWTQSLTPSFGILRKITSLYLLYPNIPIPLAIQEQILLLQLIESSPLTISIIERITVLTQRYSHLALSTSITEQISLVQLIKTTPLTIESVTTIAQLSQTYPALALPTPIMEQITLVRLIQTQPLSESIISQIIGLSSVYPTIQLPNNIQDLIVMQNFIQDIVISQYASETVVRQVVSYSQVYTFMTVPQTVQDIIQLYQLLDIVKTGSQSTDILLQIFKLSQLYPKIPIPGTVLQLIYQALQTTSSENTMTSTSVITTTTTYTLQEGVTADDELSTLISQALSSPSLALIEKIMSLTQTSSTSVVIPSIIQQQIRLVQLINSVATSFSIVESDLFEINALSQSFPHIPVSTPLQEQITLLQLINEASTCTSSSVGLLIRQITQLSSMYSRIAIPTRVQEMITLVQLIDKVIAQPAPSLYLVDEIASLSQAYPFIQVPNRIKEQSVLQRLIAQAGRTGPSQELLLQISRLSRTYPHVGLPSIMREQIKLVILLQEVSTMTAPTVDILQQISSLSSLYKFISIPSVIQEQISFVLLIERTVQSTSPSYAILRQIMELSATYPHIPVPAYLLQQCTLYQRIEDVSSATTVSLDALQQIAQLSQAFPFISLPENVGQQITLLQLINELNASPSMILVEEIMHIAPMCPNFVLPDTIQLQVTLVRLIHEVSLIASPSIDVLQQISTLAQTYSYVTVPTHVQQQITLIQILQSTSSSSSNVYPLLPQIIELSTRFPNIPIDSSYTQLITLHNLVQQVLLTPSPLPATLTQISSLYQVYPNYPVPASIFQLIQQLSSASTSVVTSPVSSPVITPSSSSSSSSSSATTITTVTTSAVSSPVGPVTEVSNTQIILRQLIAQAMQGTPTVGLLQQIASLSAVETGTPIPTAIQQQLVLLRFIEEATSSLSPTPHLLHQIAGLSANYPYIPIPSVTQQQITLVKLIEEISVAVSPSMNSIVQIATISQMFPHIPIPSNIQQQCVLYNLIQEVTRSTSPSVNVIRQIAQLSTVFRNIVIPQPIQEQITLVELISQIATSSSVSINDVQTIKSLSSAYPYIPVPNNVVEIMRLVTLVQSDSLSTSDIEEIFTLSQSYINIALPTSIQNQILLSQLIREATLTSPYTSVSLLVQISQLSPVCPSILLPLQIQEQITLIQAINQISSSLVFEDSAVQIIIQMSPIYSNIAIPDFIQQYLVLSQLTTSLTPSVSVIQQISQIISSFPVLSVPQVIQEQVRMVQLIDEFSQSPTPSIPVINQIIRLSMLYPHIPLPNNFLQIMVLKQCITDVITQINVGDDVIPQIITLSSQYPFIPIPSIVQERIDLYNLINDVSASPTIVPQTLQRIEVISKELPRVVLPTFIAEKREKMEKQNILNELISTVETTGVVTPDSLAQIEELSQFFPEIALPAVVQERIFSHIQETILQELVNEAIATPNSHPILQQIEQLSASLPEFPIPDIVVSQIIEMQQSIMLENIINEVQSAPVIDENNLHEILQLSQSLPSNILPDFIQQALTLQSLTEKILHAPSTATVDQSAIQQIIQLTSAVPTFAIPAPVQKLVDLYNLVQQVQLSPSPLDNLDQLLQIADMSQALPNFVIPSSVVQLVTSAKNTVQLRNLIQTAQTGKADISTIQQIAQLAPSLPNVPLPVPIQEQVTLVQLIQKSQSGTLGPDVIKQLTGLSKTYPNIPLPANVRQLIAPSPVMTKAKTVSTSKASEAQLKQYVSMYERMPSSMILRQIANVLPNIAEPVLPDKIMNALVQQGLVPADSFPQVQLQQLIQQYQTAPSPSLIQQISQLTTGLPGVTLPGPVQQAVAVLRAETLYNELAPLFTTELAPATILDRGVISLRQDSFDRQIELSEGYLDMARQVMRQLMENVRASGHPMHRATFSAFEAVLDLISHLINEARTVVAASRQQIMVGGEAAASTLAATSLTVQDLLGKAEGARQALLKEAKEFSVKVIESSDRVISAAQSTKNKMESVFNDLLTQSSTFSKRGARSVRRA